MNGRYVLAAHLYNSPPGPEQLQSEATKQEQEKEETEKQLAKAQKQLERLEINLEGREELEQERKITQKELVKAQKQVEKLKAELEDERARVRPPSPKRACSDFIVNISAN